jgi:hypothetical protein
MPRSADATATLADALRPLAGLRGGVAGGPSGSPDWRPVLFQQDPAAPPLR